MKLITRAALAVVLLSSSLAAQVDHGGDSGGGTWKGPGDTVPTDPRAGGGTTHPGDPSNPGAAGTGPGSTSPYGGRPPWGSGPPPPGAPGHPGEESDREDPGSRPRVDNPASWQLWWHYNRWAHLEVDHAVATAKSGSGGFYLGRGEKAETPPLELIKPEQVRDTVLPALLQALRDDPGTEFQVHGLQALAKLRGFPPAAPEDAFAAIANRFLTSASATVCEKAVLALGVRGESQYFSWLHAILHDETRGRARLGRSRIGPRIRAFAAYALGLIGDRHESPDLRNRIHANLVRALEDDREEVRAAAVLAMGLVPLPVESADSPLSPSGEPWRTRVEQVLELLDFFEDEEQPVSARCQVPVAIARLLEGAPESLRARAIRVMLLAMGVHGDQPGEIESAAVIALGRIGNSGTRAIDRELRQELESIAVRSHKRRLTRYYAIVSLALVASRPGTGEEPLEGLARVRKLLVRNLSRHRGDALCWSALGLGLIEEKAGDRGEVPASASGKALRSLLDRARSPEVVGAAAIALGLMRDPEAEDLLVEKLTTSGHGEVRGYAALALGMIEARRTVDLLRAELEASLYQPFPLEQIAIGLALLGDQPTGSRLGDLLAETSDPLVQASIASALGWIKDPRQVDRLAERLVDEEVGDGLKAWTAVALGRICDEDRWPWVGRLSVDTPYEVILPTLIEPEFQSGLLDQR